MRRETQMLLLVTSKQRMNYVWPGPLPRTAVRDSPKQCTGGAGASY